MSTVPISMRKLKEILRLKYGCLLSHRQVAKSLSISPSVVSRYANRAAQMGITSWPLSQEWDDTKLNREFLKTKVKTKSTIPVPSTEQKKSDLHECYWVIFFMLLRTVR